MNEKPQPYVLCIRNDGYEVSLERRKVYRRLEDSAASARSLIRVVDESGEDYLFPHEFFVPIEVPENAAHVFDEVTA